MHPVSQVSTRISVLQDLFKTPQELYRQAIATRNSLHIWPPWGIAFLHVCVTSRHVKVCLCKSTPQLCHHQRENHGCYLDDHPWSSYSISFKRPWLVTGLSRVLPDLFQNRHIFWFPVGVPISSPFATARCYHALCASREPPRATPGSNGGRWWCPLRHICMAWRLWLRRKFKRMNFQKW